MPGDEDYWDDARMLALMQTSVLHEALKATLAEDVHRKLEEVKQQQAVEVAKADLTRDLHVEYHARSLRRTIAELKAAADPDLPAR